MKQWRWKTENKIIPIGKTFAVAPPWIEINRIRISLVMGSSFGTGIHETTISCIEEMENIEIKGRKVLDIGTGSGILSIAASKLGAEEIIAFDIDPNAVYECSQNIELNSVKNVKCSIASNIPQSEEKFDIILANIFDSAILGMATNIKTASQRGTMAILSGISPEESYTVKRKFIHLGFSLIKSRFLEEYVTYVLQMR